MQIIKSENKLLDKLLFKNSRCAVIPYENENDRTKVRAYNTYSDKGITESIETLNYFIYNRLSFDLVVYYGKQVTSRRYSIRFTEDEISFGKLFTKFTEYDKFQYSKQKIMESI